MATDRHGYPVNRWDLDGQPDVNNVVYRTGQRYTGTANGRYINVLFADNQGGPSKIWPDDLYDYELAAIAQHHNAIEHYLTYGDPDDLYMLPTKVVGGRFLELDLDVLEDLANIGELDIEMYEEV